MAMRFLVCAVLCFQLAAQDLRILDGPAAARFSEPRRMLRSHLTRLALDQLAARKAEVARVANTAQLDARRAAFRKSLLAMIGGLPAARTPLNVRRTGALDRDGYRVEKLVFESQPGFYVTANLYVPKTGKPPYPAVLHSTGHSTSAKARAFYQTLSLGLVKHGFVVLTCDPLGQGERRLFFDAALEDSKVGGTTVEHEMVGIQSLLAGESIARYMIWDALRAIDLLSGLPEVDAARIGITGCSGGGTLTTYIGALDDRVRAAAPACYISSWEDQLQADTGPQDAEQQFPNLLAGGWDHADFVEAFAPRPYLICSTDQDFFPLEGARRTYEEARRIWGLFQAEDRIAWFHEPGGHGMPQATREAIYGWMKRWLAGGPAGPAPEPDLRTEYEQDLLATSTGQVATSLGGETASTSNIRRFAALRPPALDAARLREEIVRLTAHQYRPRDLRVTSFGQVTREGYTVERLVYQDGDAGLYVPALLAVPAAARSRGKTVLWVGEGGAAAAFRAGEDLDRLASGGYAVLAIDASGRGETASGWGGYSGPWFGRQEKETWLALMTGRTLVGLRMEDIRLGLDVLEKRGLAKSVTGLGKAGGAIDLLHAAALDTRLGALALEDMLVSYEAVARAPLHRAIFESVVPAVLGRYDLPGIAATLAPRPVSLVNARSPMGSILPLATVPAAANVRRGLRRESESVLDAFPEFR